MDAEETWQVVTEQRLGMADLLTRLSDSDWEHPSLCDGWRVRDVAAHVTAIPIPPSPGSLLVDFAKARGNYARFNTVATRRRARRTPSQIVGDLRASAESHTVPWPVNPANVLWDILVHAQDIAIPLGIDVPTPADAGAAAATRLWDLRWPLTFGARRRLRGLKVTATDTDWTIGTGREVAGPIKAILLLLSGRTETAAPMLTGDGVRRLSAV